MTNKEKFLQLVESKEADTIKRAKERQKHKKMPLSLSFVSACRYGDQQQK